MKPYQLIERERQLALQQRALEHAEEFERARRVRNYIEMAKAFGRVVSLEVVRNYDYNACK